MRFVQVCGNDDFIAVPQQTPGKFNTHGMGLVRRHLAGSEGLDDVVALPFPPLLTPAPLGVHHVGVNALPVAVDGGLETGLFRFLPVQGVVDGGLQGGLFRVLGIAHAFVQAVVND